MPKGWTKRAGHKKKSHPAFAATREKEGKKRVTGGKKNDGRGNGKRRRAMWMKRRRVEERKWALLNCAETRSSIFSRFMQREITQRRHARERASLFFHKFPLTVVNARRIISPLVSRCSPRCLATRWSPRHDGSVTLRRKSGLDSYGFFRLLMRKRAMLRLNLGWKKSISELKRD